MVVVSSHSWIHVVLEDGSEFWKYEPALIEEQCPEDEIDDFDSPIDQVPIGHPDAVTNGSGNLGNDGTDFNWGQEEVQSVILGDEIPCLGNPVKKPRIAPQENSGINGGRYGNTRTNGIQKHGGLDIANNIGDNIYSPFNGRIVSIGYEKELGNYITIQFQHSDGYYYTIQFAHLKENPPIKNGDIVQPGKTIGKQGVSGNLEEGIAKGLTEPHTHIKVAKRTGTSWNISTYSPINPEFILTTKFDLMNGTPIPSTDC